MRSLKLLNHGSPHAVLASDHATPGKGLRDPERLLIRRQTRGHQGKTADAQQRTAELLGQGSCHHHRETCAGESSGPGRNGQTLELTPAAAGQQGRDPLDQAVGETSSVIEPHHPRAVLVDLGILHRHSEAFSAAVQGQQ